MVSKLYDVLEWEKPDTFKPGSTKKITSKKSTALSQHHAKKAKPLEKPLGKILLDARKISEENIEKALITQSEQGGSLGDILVSMELITEKDFAIALSKQLGLPIARPSDYPEEALLAETISERFLQEFQVIPIKERSDGIAIAMLDPTNDYIKEAIHLAVDKPVICCVVVMSEFRKAFEKLYGAGKSIMEQIADDIGGDEDFSDEDDVEHLKDLASEAPIIRLVSLVIHDAIAARASDIHIEPFETNLKVRYRIDGILKDVESPPSSSCAAVISRIKIMAKLDIAERRLPQDGRIKLRVENKEVDLRVSTIPTMHGESIVMRILLNDSIATDFDSLGFVGEPLDIYLECLNQPHGILLVTGPTGSGKTTTLYTSLQKLNTPGRKILTVEDPVEYQLEGINQIQVKPSIGLTFSDALRSIVRQDPDIIMIGEMRDLETAQIAIQSALTGHMVLSTLHTNDAPSSLTRLMDMGIEDYLITSSVSGVLAQRLVRKLCDHCKSDLTACEELIEEMNLIKYTDNNHLHLKKAVGCHKCNGTGYNGRLSIVQMMLMTDPIRRLVMQHADAREIQKKALESGMESMLDDGLRKAVKGLTTVEEVLRVTQD
ncbi:MAG: type II secretion system ATPase GspE [Methylococcales bacterium]|nr:type II secretion system ATPase GspE [Methylococcales bacterium]MBT7410473.1 type II secretion system ATPase GspE [Methylococcales bacterium]